MYYYQPIIRFGITDIGKSLFGECHNQTLLNLEIEILAGLHDLAEVCTFVYWVRVKVGLIYIKKQTTCGTIMSVQRSYYAFLHGRFNVEYSSNYKCSI